MWIGLVQPSVAVAVPTALVAAYAYNAPAHNDAPRTSGMAERGPPASCDRGITYDAVAIGSRGVWACPGALTAPVSYNYDGTARPVRTARGSRGVEGRTVGTRQPTPSLNRLQVAAEDGAPPIKAVSQGGDTAGKAFSQSMRQDVLAENPSTSVYCRMETDRPQVDP